MMSKNHAGELYSGYAKGPTGMGFGYTVAITLDSKLAKNGQSEGSYGWGGALGTYTWTDPKEDVAAVIMVQQSTSTLSTRIAESINAAILGSDGKVKNSETSASDKEKDDSGIKSCKEGEVYEGKGSKWVCKNGSWIEE